jgi:hypothetical protein
MLRHKISFAGLELAPPRFCFPFTRAALADSSFLARLLTSCPVVDLASGAGSADVGALGMDLGSASHIEFRSMFHRSRCQLLLHFAGPGQGFGLLLGLFSSCCEPGHARFSCWLRDFWRAQITGPWISFGFSVLWQVGALLFSLLSSSLLLNLVHKKCLMKCA